MQGVALGDHGSGDACAGADLLIGCGIVHNGAPQTVFGLVQLERGKLVIQAADNVQKLGVEVALRQPHADLRHRVGRPRIGAAPLDARHVVAGNIVVAVVVQPAFGVLQVLDVPVILVQRIVDELFVLQQYAHAQQEEARHKECVCPRLLGEIVVDRDGVLQNMIAEAQRLLFKILDLAFGDVQILFITGMLIQGDQAVPHRAGVDRPARQAQLNILVHAVLDKLQVALIFGDLIRLADAVVGHAAGPVPRHIHPHRAVHDLVDGSLDLGFVKNQVCHGSLLFYSGVICPAAARTVCPSTYSQQSRQLGLYTRSASAENSSRAQDCR